MAIKAYRPTTPARRGMTSQDLLDVTSLQARLKSLIKSKSNKPAATIPVKSRLATAVVVSAVITVSQPRIVPI